MKEKPICFWRETVLPTGKLSQWFNQPFVENGITFPTAEHYMMYHKALLFNDKHIAYMLTSNPARHPREIKALGRKVKNFNNNVWEKHRLSIVTEGNWLKFSQNPDLKDYLLSTGDAELIEASPYDAIWGIGIDERDFKAGKPYTGLNLLGIALMDVRKRLRESE